MNKNNVRQMREGTKMYKLISCFRFQAWIVWIFAALAFKDCEQATVEISRAIFRTWKPSSLGSGESFPPSFLIALEENPSASQQRFQNAACL